MDGSGMGWTERCKDGVGRGGTGKSDCGCNRRESDVGNNVTTDWSRRGVWCLDCAGLMVLRRIPYRRSLVARCTVVLEI